MNTRQTGNVYEQMAADYLEKQGMRILERNFRRGRNGEIDIIGRDGKYLVFVEVKYRSGDEKGNAAEAVTTAKQRTICRVADYYRYLHHYGEDTWVRYDVVAIQGETLHWIPNAFVNCNCFSRRIARQIDRKIPSFHKKRGFCAGLNSY